VSRGARSEDLAREGAAVLEDALREHGYEVDSRETRAGFLVRALNERTGKLAGAFGVDSAGKVTSKGETDMEENILERLHLGSFASAGKLTDEDKEVLAHQAGEAYADDQIQSDTFREYVWEDIYNTTNMSEEIAPEFKDDALLKSKTARMKLAKNMLQNLRWDIERDGFEAFDDYFAPLGLDADDYRNHSSVRDAFWEGLRVGLDESASAREWVAEEIILQAVETLEEEKKPKRRTKR
jgi:hypothetical protein